MPRDERERIAILGGGPAGVATAFELTATPELRERYQVTIYQPGWRLGGKCASGRNRAHGDRIEEHGLHVWFGFYDNGFDVMRRCYSELGRPPEHPLATWRDAFKPCDDIVLYEHWKGDWRPWHFHVPNNPLVPGQGLDLSFWDVLEKSLYRLRASFERLLWERSDAVTSDAAETGRGIRLGWFDRLHDEIDEKLDDLQQAAGRHLLELAQKLAGGGGVRDPAHTPWIVDLLNEFEDWLWEHIVKERVDDDDWRRFYMLVDFWCAIVTGIVEDDVLEKGFGQINDRDLREWLGQHGADELTLSAPFLQGLYDLVFAYPGGDKSTPNVAAGKAMQASLRIGFGYKGAILWKMQAGMGDVVFAPLYEVLRHRGVEIEFFHWVTRLGVSDDGRSIDEVEVVRQAQTRDGGDYRPLYDVKGLPCWPSTPDWVQLQDGEELRLRGVDFEREANPLGVEPTTLRAGADFDHAVLAIPVGAQREMCAELAEANERYRAMLEQTPTVMTQALQLWVDDTAHPDLGWPFGVNSIMSSYCEPLDTYCNMSQLAVHENMHGLPGPVNVGYFCAVLREEGLATQEDADIRVHTNAVRYLTGDMEPIWPAAVTNGTFDWGLLVDPNGGEGAKRLDSQYLRANFQGTDRYVLTTAGSIGYRLAADESGFDNLVLAGDWTRNGIDGGAVEAAITSGMLASRAISGSPEEIPGTSGWLADD